MPSWLYVAAGPKLPLGIIWSFALGVVLPRRANAGSWAGFNRSKSRFTAASNLHSETPMPVLKQIIDVVAQSDRPVRRLIAYYVFVGLIVLALAYFIPSVGHLLSGKGLEASPNTTQLLQDGLSKKATHAAIMASGSLAELAVTTIIILIGTLVLMLPVSWVYMSARRVQGHNQAVVQTLIILPLVVAGVIIVVQNSLALAFSLAGVVGAVRFRTTLRDTRDLVFIFLSIGVGFAAGVQAMVVGALLSIVFNFVLILTWRYDYGRNVLTPSASAQWAGPLEALASPTGEHLVPDRDLVLSLTPRRADVLADRFERVRDVIGKKTKKARFNAVLTITTDKVTEAQAQVETVLEKMTKRWRLDEVVTNVGKPSEIYYLTRLKKTVTRDDILTGIHDNAGETIATADLEIGEPAAEEKNGEA